MEAIQTTATKAGNSGHPDLRGWLQQLPQPTGSPSLARAFR